MHLNTVLRRLGLSRTAAGLVALLGTYLGLLWVLRPLTPFEWDEVLFLRSMHLYDPAAHFPHPPGYPVFVAAGRALCLLLSDPLAALHLVTVLAVGVALASLWRLARSLGAERLPATAAAALLAAVPAFAFLSNVGMSDVAGAAAAIVAVLALVPALDEPRRLPLAAAVVALAGGVRPQLVAVLLPVAVVALARTVRGRHWKALALAAAAWSVVTLACWLPPILISGRAEYVAEFVAQSRYVATVEAGYRLPAARILSVLRSWLVDPLGEAPGAVLFWALVVTGTVRWWRRGARRLVFVAGATALSWLLVAMWTHNMTVAVRYVLPALPFLCLLAAGSFAARAPRRQLASAAILVAVCAVSFGWLAPALLLRSRQPAPLWEMLTLVGQRFDAGRTQVVFEGDFTPHVEYLLLGPTHRLWDHGGPYRCTMARPATLYEPPDPDTQLVFVTSDPSPGQQLVASARWSCEPLHRLSRGRYERCVVALPPPRGAPRYSPDFHEFRGQLWLVGTGLVALGVDAAPQFARVRAAVDSVAVSVRGGPPRTLPPGGETLALVWPSPDPALRISGPKESWVRLAAIEWLPLTEATRHLVEERVSSSELFIPVAAHAPGHYGTFWVTDALLSNPDTASPARVTLSFSSRGQTRRAPTPLEREVPPAGTVLLSDLLAELVSGRDVGSVRLWSKTPFVAAWRTYNAKLPPDQPRPSFLPAISERRSRQAGVFPELPFLDAPHGLRSTVSFLNTSAQAVEVRLHIARRGEQSQTSSTTLDLEPYCSDGFDTVADSAGISPDPVTVAVSFEASAPVFAWATIIENRTGAISYVLPEPRP